MTQTTMRFRSRVFVTAFILGGSACSWMPASVDPEFLALERTLRLEIASAARLFDSGAAEVTYKLSNQGTGVAKACLGPGRDVTFRASGSSWSSLRFVHHAGCVKEFTLQPGGDMTWREELEIAPKSQGSVEIEVEIEILNPRTCGSPGCSSVQVRSKPYSIP